MLPKKSAGVAAADHRRHPALREAAGGEGIDLDNVFFLWSALNMLLPGSPTAT